jgi:hypothetical protein
VIALALSALVTSYLLIPNALFRFLLGRFVPLRIFQERKTEDLTRAVVTLFISYVIGLMLVWHVPGCKSWPLIFSDSPTLRIKDYESVLGGMYSEAVFKADPEAFWVAAWRTCQRQGRVLFWYYVAVIVFALLSGWAIKNYGRFRRFKLYVWLMEFLLMPHVSQWHVLLTPFTFADKHTVVKADVLMTDNTLYQGEVADYFLDKDGNLSGMFLGRPYRFDRRAYFREQETWQHTRARSKFWKEIPSAKLYLVADKIVNLNLNYEPPASATEVIKFLEILQKGHPSRHRLRFAVSIAQSKVDPASSG